MGRFEVRVIARGAWRNPGGAASFSRDRAGDYGAFSALFPGDAGFRAEARLKGRVGAVDVLKVGHHGSRGSTSETWLAELTPRVAVISVGRNTYGHPAPEVLERLAAGRAAVWRTDTDGSVSIRTDGRTMTVTGRRGSATYPVD